VLEILVKSGCSRQVIRHCKAVSALAVQIAEACKERGFNVNVQLVRIGALLHDMGRSVTHSVDHAVIGAELARALGLPSSVVSIIERHAGGGITMDEAKKLGWPVKDYFPQTLEEKIVTYADKLIEGSQMVNIERSIRKLSEELGGDHPAIKRVKQLHREFSSLLGDINADSHAS
jgi:uncharacterized protein